MYCIILPRARGKMIQLTTHFECLISSTNVTLCLFFFLSSCSLYLTVYYTFKSKKIYPVIKAGKKYFKKVDHFAPVSPTECKAMHSSRIFFFFFFFGGGVQARQSENSSSFLVLNMVRDSPRDLTPYIPSGSTHES